MYGKVSNFLTVHGIKVHLISLSQAFEELHAHTKIFKLAITKRKLLMNNRVYSEHEYTIYMTYFISSANITSKIIYNAYNQPSKSMR